MGEQGKCPKCGSSDLNYGVVGGHGGEEIYFPYTCGSCGFEGQEWYTVEFDTMTDMEGEEV